MKKLRTKSVKMLTFLALASFTWLVINCSGGQEGGDHGDGSTDSTASDSSALANGWEIPFNVKDGASATQEDYYRFAWESFIAYNWPADASYNGQPDTTQAFGATQTNGLGVPVVWEQYKDKSDVFMPNAQEPGAWNSANTPVCSNNDGGDKMFVMFAKSDNSTIVNDEFNESTGNPLIDQDSNYVLFEIKINESEFTYIKKYQYYNADVQKQAVSDTTFQTPPKGQEDYVKALPAFAQQGASEFKASWRIIPDDMPSTQKERYYRRTAYILDPDGSCRGPVTVGLIGFHILRLTPTTGSTWYWATFEQVDNVELQSAYGGVLPATPTLNPGPNGNPAPPYTPNGYYGTPPAKITDSLETHPTPSPISRLHPIPAAAEAMNAEYFEKVEGTVWQYYQLVDVMNPAVGGNTDYPVPNNSNAYTNTNKMANTTMESYSQLSNPDCLSCHAFGTPQYYQKDSALIYPNYQIFTFLLGNATSPPSGGE